MTDITDFCVIANRRSGRGAGREKILEESLAAHPGRFTLKIASRNQPFDKVIREALEEGFKTLVAAGGDGTVNAVAGGLVHKDQRLGVIPMGTFNYFARALGIPPTIPEATQALLQSEERRVDVGLINGAVFINNASLGAYPAILRDREQLYRRWGRSRIAALISVVRVLADQRRPMRLKIEIEGERIQLRSPSVFIASNAYQLDYFSAPGAQAVREGRLAAMIAPNERPLKLILHAVRTGLGKGAPDYDYRLITAREMTIETSRPRRSVARDGERERMKGPYRLELAQGALRVLAPKRDGGERS